MIVIHRASQHSRSARSHRLHLPRFAISGVGVSGAFLFSLMAISAFAYFVSPLSAQEIRRAQPTQPDQTDQPVNPANSDLNQSSIPASPLQPFTNGDLDQPNEPAASPTPPEIRRALPATTPPPAVAPTPPEIRRALPVATPTPLPAETPFSQPFLTPAPTPAPTPRPSLTPTPTPTATPEPSPIRKVIVDLKADGQILLNHKPVTEKQLQTRLTRLSQRHPDQTVILHGEKHVTYQRIIQVLGIFKAANITNSKITYDNAANPASQPSPTPTPKPSPASTPTPQPSPTSTPAPGEVADHAITKLAPTPAPQSANDQSDASKIQINYANGLYSRKLYDVAAAEYQKYLSLYPQGPDGQAALFRLAECYRNLGDHRAAKKAYNQLLNQFLDGRFVGLAAYRLADIYFKEGKYTEALPLFRKASVHIQNPAVSTAAKFFAAQCLEKLKLNSEAEIVYKNLLETPGNQTFRDTSRLAFAKLLAGSGKKAEALKQLEILTAQTTKPALKVEALVRSGLLEIDLSHFKKAEKDLKAALKNPAIGTWKEVAQLGLLRLLYQDGKYAKLNKNYQDNSTAFSAKTEPEVLMLAGDSNRMLNHQKKALGLYDQLIKTYPDSAFARQASYERLVSLYNAGSANLPQEVDAFLATKPSPAQRDQALLIKAENYYRHHQYKAAIPAYAALSAASELPKKLQTDAQFKLAWCYLQSSDFTHAIDAFTKFIKANPTSPLAATALAERAIANQKLQHYGAALKDFETLLTEHPKAKERELALQQKALILGQQNHNEKMADTFRQLLKEFPHSSAAAQADYWIGWTAFQSKDYKNAIAPLEAARKLDRDQFYERATLRLILAHYYLQQKDALAREVRDYAKHGKAACPPDILRWLGQEFMQSKQYAQASEFLSILVKSKSDAANDDWLNLGRAQLGSKKYAAAEKSLQTYLASVKNPFPQASGLLALGEAELGQKKLDAAQKAADKVCELQPEGRLNAEGRMLSGHIAEARGDYSSAAKLFLSVSVVFDDPALTPEALSNAYKAYKKAGDPDQAAKTLNALQTRYPEYWQSRHKKN